MLILRRSLRKTQYKFMNKLMKKAINKLILASTLLAAFGPLHPAMAQTLTTLYSFSGGSDGANPQAPLLLCSNVLYGTAVYGGTNGDGTVFQMNTDGSGFAPIYNFSDTGDGANPLSQLVSSGNFLYGTTADYNNLAGTVFQISTMDGSFTTLYDFSTSDTGEGSPMAGLTLSGTNLFGTTQLGGDNSEGSIFELNTNGTIFNTLYTFSPDSYSDVGYLTNSDGANPQSQLLLSGNVLYGTACRGGNGGHGTIFSLNTDGTGFTTLHSFDQGDFSFSLGSYTNSDGEYPACGLTLSGNTLYGTTSAGGLLGGGTVFKMNLDGTGFTVLHTFGDPNTPNDGFNPTASLVVSGNTIYGTTVSGGSQGAGTVFQINTDGSGYQTLYSGDPSGTDGFSFEAGLILSGNTLFGTATDGGADGQGTVFSLSLSAPQPQAQLSISVSGSNVTLTWPASVTGLTLQSTPCLSSANWTPLSLTPTVVNGQNIVTTSITNVSQFYRLAP